MQCADADIRLICAACYEQTRARNWREPRGAFAKILRTARAVLEPRQEKLTREFRITDFPRWDWSQETGKLVFSGARRRKLVADFLFAGSISTHSKTWLWSWANDSLAESVKAPAEHSNTTPKQCKKKVRTLIPPLLFFVPETNEARRVLAHGLHVHRRLR